MSDKWTVSFNNRLLLVLHKRSLLASNLFELFVMTNLVLTHVFSFGTSVHVAYCLFNPSSYMHVRVWFCVKLQVVGNCPFVLTKNKILERCASPYSLLCLFCCVRYCNRPLRLRGCDLRRQASRMTAKAAMVNKV